MDDKMFKDLENDNDIDKGVTPVQNLLNNKDIEHNQLNPFASFNNRSIKIYHNDCMNFLDSLSKESVDIIVTDPAYSGMNQKMKFGNGRIVGNYGKKDDGKWFKEFHDTKENYKEFLKKCDRVLKPHGVLYIMFDSFSLLTLGNTLRDHFNVKNIITWDKVNMGMGHHFRRRHEFIVYMTKNNTKLNARIFPDVWRIKRLHKATYPTQKPTEIFEIMLAASAKPGFVVCDPFMGISSSAIATINKKCMFIGSDISEKACELSAKRIQEYITTGSDPYQKKSLLPDGEKKLF
jgi:site-specific DNA-methyltransferase (adenine-specific)